MISRRLQIINDFLNKGIMLARGFHVSKAKFELFAEKIENLFLHTLSGYEIPRCKSTDRNNASLFTIYRAKPG